MNRLIRFPSSLNSSFSYHNPSCYYLSSLLLSISLFFLLIHDVRFVSGERTSTSNNNKDFLQSKLASQNFIKSMAKDFYDYPKLDLLLHESFILDDDHAAVKKTRTSKEVLVIQHQKKSWRCTIPVIPSKHCTKTTKSSSKEQSQKQDQQDQEQGEEEEGPKAKPRQNSDEKLTRIYLDKLSLIFPDECLTLESGWWSFEYCPGKTMKQIYIGPKSEDRVGVDVNTEKYTYLIGNFNPNSIKEYFDKLEKRNVMTSDDSPIGHDHQKLHAFDRDELQMKVLQNARGEVRFQQIWGEGDICDVTGLPRLTVMEFSCSKTTNSSFIESVKEIGTCKYQAQIKLKELCFDTSELNLPTSQIIHGIHCYKI